jgi:hypothetical protein
VRRQRRSLHNAGAADRPGDRGDRVLAVGQLLVAGPRGTRRHRGLTNGETPPESRRPDQRRQRIVVVYDVTTVESRERLAPGRALRRRLHHQSLTPRVVRQERQRQAGGQLPTAQDH